MWSVSSRTDVFFAGASGAWKVVVRVKKEPRIIITFATLHLGIHILSSKALVSVAY